MNADDLLLRLGEAALRSLPLVAICLIVLLCLRRASAAARHLVLALTLVAMLLLPCASVVLPTRDVPVPAPVSLSADILPNSLPAAEQTAVDVSSREGEIPSVAVDTAAPAVDLPADEAFLTPSNAVRSPANLLLGVYLAGAGLFLFRLVVALFRLELLARCVPEVTAGPLWERVQAAMSETKQLRSIRIIEVGRGVIPATWGVLRPVLLLPREAEEWPEERLNVVLLHEMAHIRRRDFLTGVVVRIVCAVWWFHPFVWWAAARLQREAEAACDDRALLSGRVTPAGYAGHLLDLARYAQQTKGMPEPAVAMARRRPSVRERFDAVLDQARNRRPVSKRGTAASFSIALLLLLSAATLRPVVRAAEAESILAEDAPGTSRRVLPNGVSVEIVGITNDRSLIARGCLQSPSGEAILPRSPVDKIVSIRRGDAKGITAPVVTMRVRYPQDVLVSGTRPAEEWMVTLGSPETPSRKAFLRFPVKSDAISGNDRTLRWLVLMEHQLDGSTDLRYTVATGQWKTVATCPVDSATNVLNTEVGRLQVSFSPARGNWLRVSLPASNHTLRIWCRDADGTMRPVGAEEGVPLCASLAGISGAGRSFELAVPKQPGKPLPREFVFQARPAYTAEFRGLSLRGVATQSDSIAQLIDSRIAFVNAVQHLNSLRQKVFRLRPARVEAGEKSLQQLYAAIEEKRQAAGGRYPTPEEMAPVIESLFQMVSPGVYYRPPGDGPGQLRPLRRGESATEVLAWMDSYVYDHWVQAHEVCRTGNNRFFEVVQARDPHGFYLVLRSQGAVERRPWNKVDPQPATERVLFLPSNVQAGGDTADQQDKARSRIRTLSQE